MEARQVVLRDRCVPVTVSCRRRFPLAAKTTRELGIPLLARAPRLLAVCGLLVWLTAPPVGKAEPSGKGVPAASPRTVREAGAMTDQAKPTKKGRATPAAQRPEGGPRSPTNACDAPLAGGILPKGGGVLSGDTFGAGDDFDGSLYSDPCGYSYGPSGNDEIWAFTVESDGLWTFDTCTIPAQYDTSIGITVDIGIGCPGVGVVCNGDDACQSFLCGPGGDEPCYESAIRDVCLSAADAYWLIVDGWSPASYFPGTYYDVTYALTQAGCCDTGADCNKNGVPDSCDIDSGDSQDTNNNGVPDECEHYIGIIVPEPWRANDVLWIRDVTPHNGIDDLIDDSPDQEFEIVVDYNRCVTEGDVAFLNNLSPTSHVQKVGRYITFILAGGMRKADIELIAALPEVALVELQTVGEYTLDVSLENLKVTNGTGTYFPNTLENMFPSIDGYGITIAIMDSGVYETHDAFVGHVAAVGFDGPNDTTAPPANIPDQAGHGTHVASIALGQATVDYPYRGVAPGATLIELKNGVSFPTTAASINGMEYLINLKEQGGSVDVVNMSFGLGVDDGTTAFSRVVDRAEDLNILVVAAAGNVGQTCFGNLKEQLNTPASATRAIAVAASNDNGNPNRSLSTLASFSCLGPRPGDLDAECIDELKPEVAAPGASITAARAGTQSGTIEQGGTSMASPHVAGLAALIMQRRPGINAASVKQMIIKTAELPLGIPPTLPCDPVWNQGWGWGLVDAFTAIQKITETDLTFPNYPSNPIWLSPDISTASAPRMGDANRIYVKVVNLGPLAATNARVHFGILDFNATIPATTVPEFDDVGTVVTDIPVTGPGKPNAVTFSVPWTPLRAGHQCAKVEIGYGNDVNYANNIAQRNLTVASSPVTVKVANHLTELPGLIEFEVTVDDPPSQWLVDIDPPNVLLAAGDCSVDVRVLAVPANALPAEGTETIHIGTRIGNQVMGGVSIIATKEDCNANDIEDFLDIRDGTSSDDDLNGIPDECEGERDWHIQSDRGSEARRSHAVAYDGVRQESVLFGGFNGTSALDDTWVFDGTSWVQEFPASSPSARYGHQLVYDLKRDVIVLFGGTDGAVNNELWEWDGDDWTLRSTSGPGPRHSFGMAYDSGRGVTVVYGGDSGSGHYEDTWEWNGNQWELRDIDSAPGPRSGHAMAYDNERHEVLLFGGETPGGSFNNQLWAWRDGNVWVLRTSGGPEARRGHSMAFDSATDMMILFGGQTGTGLSGETWKYDGQTEMWSLVSTGPSPSARWLGAMTFDARRSAVVLFGGDSGTLSNETWQHRACLNALDCADSNVCTDDSCDPATGCVHVDNTAPCDDGNACTTDDTCSAGACVGGSPGDCDDGLFCNGIETCDLAGGCIAGDPPCPPSWVCDEDLNACIVPPFPTVSEWGLVVLTLLLLIGVTVCFGRRKTVRA